MLPSAAQVKARCVALQEAIDDPFSNVSEYFYGRGIDAKTCEILRWGVCQKRGETCVSIPRYHDGECVGVKFRSIARNPQCKWHQASGSTKVDFLYGTDDYDYFSSSSTVFIAEGEHEHALLKSLGFNSVAIFGTSGVPKELTESFETDLTWLTKK